MRKLVESVVLVVISAVLASAMAEVTLRVFPGLLPEEVRLKLHWASIKTNIRLVNDPTIGFLYPPNAAFEISNGEVQFVLNTDKSGFRNIAPWPATADIILLGDSMAVGYGVDYDAAWLPRMARAQGNVSLVNLGMTGASPQQYAAIYERFGVPLTPKVVLLCLFPGNDIDDALTFDRWQRGAPRENFLQWREQRNSPDDTHWYALAVQHSYLASFLAYAPKALKSAEERRGRVIELANGRVRVVPSLDARAVSRGMPGTRGFEVIMDSIQRTKALATQNGSHLIVVLMPTKSEVYLPAIGAQAPSPIAPFAAALGELDIEQLDLRPYFQDEARKGRQLHFEVDGHPNAAGYALMADVVSAWLRERKDRLGIPQWR